MKVRDATPTGREAVERLNTFVGKAYLCKEMVSTLAFYIGVVLTFW